MIKRGEIKKKSESKGKKIKKNKRENKEKKQIHFCVQSKGEAFIIHI